MTNTYTSPLGNITRTKRTDTARGKPWLFSDLITPPGASNVTILDHGTPSKTRVPSRKVLRGAANNKMAG